MTLPAGLATPLALGIAIVVRRDNSYGDARRLHAQHQRNRSANGKTANFQNSTAWGNESYTNNRSVTGVNGTTATSNTSASYAPGSTSRQTTVTGFTGQSTNCQRDRTWGDGTYSDTKSFTDINGGTRTNTVSRSGGSITNTLIGRNGHSRTFTRARPIIAGK